MAFLLNRFPLFGVLTKVIRLNLAAYSNGISDPGAGAGRGGGSGGSVREAGGAFGKMEAAREEEYFRRIRKLQLKNLHDKVNDEIEYHERHLKLHREAIERHKKKQADLKRQEDHIDKNK